MYFVSCTLVLVQICCCELYVHFHVFIAWEHHTSIGRHDFVSPFLFFFYTDNCSQVLGDTNCEECEFDSNGMPICTRCKGSYNSVGGKCEREGMYSIIGK